MFLRKSSFIKIYFLIEPQKSNIFLKNILQVAYETVYLLTEPLAPKEKRI